MHAWIVCFSKPRLFIIFFTKLSQKWKKPGNKAAKRHRTCNIIIYFFFLQNRGALLLITIRLIEYMIVTLLRDGLSSQHYCSAYETLLTAQQKYWLWPYISLTLQHWLVVNFARLHLVQLSLQVVFLLFENWQWFLSHIHVFIFGIYCVRFPICNLQSEVVYSWFVHILNLRRNFPDCNLQTT